MKKHLFTVFTVFPLVLSGCSLFSKNANDDQPDSHLNDDDKINEETDTDPVEVDNWEPVYETNVFEHWYEDRDGHTQRAPHDFRVIAETPASCNEHMHQTLECKDCGYKKYVEGDKYLEHKYTSTVTQEAKCHTPGVITFSCELCDDTFTKPFTNDEAHHFVLNSEVAGVKNFSCDNPDCSETKQIIDHSQDVSAQVATNTLGTGKEVQLQNAAVALDDDTIRELGENVTIGAEEKTTEAVTEELNLNEDVQEKLDGKPILDFSLTDGGEAVSSFAGSVRVTIPYELQPGEDKDGIAIWYLGEDGPEPIQASYNDGNVSFETTHFSYYAVVHLDPEEVCKSFGHEFLPGQSVESSCAVHGYSDQICRRCHKTERTTLPLKEHNWQYLEKLDPTTTSTGYVRYKCEMCEQVDERIIPKLEGNAEDGFYINLIKSLLTPEFKVYSEETVNGENMSYGMCMGLDYDGQYFEYSSDGSSFVYKGYSYRNYLDRFENNDSTAAMLDMVRLIIDYVPQIYKDNIEDVISWAVGKYLVKEETPEGYTFSLNNAALHETMDLLANAKLSVAIPAIIGQDNYNAFLGFIRDHYENTVSEFVAAIEAEGFFIRELQTAMENIAGLFNIETENLPNLNEIIEENADVPLTRFLEQMITMVMQSMYGASAHGSKPEENHNVSYPVHRDPEIGGEDPLDPEHGEGGSGESAPSMIPATYAEFETMLNTYLDFNLIELMVGLVPVQSGIFNASLVRSYLNVAIEAIDDQRTKLTLKTTANGSFISMEATTSGIEISNPVEDEIISVEYVYAKVTKSFDKGEVLKELDARVAQFEKTSNAFDITANNYEWFAKPYEDYYKKSYPDFKFTFYPNYNERGNDALVSNVAIRTVVGYSWYRGNATTAYDTGKLVLLLQNGGYDPYIGMPGYKNRGQITKNYLGYGTVLKKGETALSMYSSNEIQAVYLNKGESSSETLTYDTYVSKSNIPSFDTLFNINTYEYTYSDYNGSFDYFYGDNDVYPVLSSKEEYKEYLESHVAYYNQFSEQEMDARYFIKVLDGNGHFRYFTTYTKNYDLDNWILTRSVLTSSMNNKALEHASTFQIVYYLRNGVLYKTAPFRDLTGFGKSYDSDRNMFDAGYYNYHDQDKNYVGYNWETFTYDTSRGRDYSYSVSFGNISGMYSAKRTSEQCKRDITFKISVNGRTVETENHTIHLNIGAWQEWNEVSREQVSGCEYEVLYNHVCNFCGETIGQHTETETDHDYVIHHVTSPATSCEYTVASYQYDYDTCTRCDYRYYYNFSFDAPCSHYDHDWDADTHMLTCNMCDYEVESENGAVPELIYEEFSRENGVITYSVYSPRLHYYTNSPTSLNSYYDFYLVVGYKDEETGNFVTVYNVDALNEANLTFSLIPVNDTYLTDYYGQYTLAFTLSFNESCFDELLSQAIVEHPKASATIIAQAKDSGTQFIYQL